MASTDPLDELLCILNEKFSFAEKSSKLTALKNICEQIIVNETKKKADRKVFVCEFSQLHFSQSEQQSCANYFPVR
jgi:hypothetical protein